MEHTQRDYQSKGAEIGGEAQQVGLPVIYLKTELFIDVLSSRDRTGCEIDRHDLRAHAGERAGIFSGSATGVEQPRPVDHRWRQADALERLRRNLFPGSIGVQSAWEGVRVVEFLDAFGSLHSSGFSRVFR